MREWKKAGVDSRGGKCRSKSYGTPTRDYIEKTSSSYFVGLVLILLTEWSAISANCSNRKSIHSGVWRRSPPESGFLPGVWVGLGVCLKE